jgi:hypothetical protein
MRERNFRSGLTSALREVRPSRLLILLLASFAAALASDWLREERVIFPAPLPKFTTVPKGP